MSQSVQEVLEDHLRHWREALRSGLGAAQEARGSPYVVTISGAHGAMSTAISKLCGAQLDLPVYDRELIDHVATSAQAFAEMSETLTAPARRRLEDFGAPPPPSSSWESGEVLDRLAHTVAALWQLGSCVLVGRGSVQHVPRSHALRVRLTATEAHRARYLARLQQRENGEILESLRKIDAQRRARHRAWFGAEVDDCARYDLSIDTGALGFDGAARIVATAFRLKFKGAWRANESS